MTATWPLMETGIVSTAPLFSYLDSATSLPKPASPPSPLPSGGQNMNFAPNWTTRELFKVALTCAPDPEVILVEGAANVG